MPDATISRVHSEQYVPSAVAEVLAEQAATSVVVPVDLDRWWVAEWSTRFDVLVDHGAARATLLRIDASVTRAATAIAASGTVVLDGGRGQGRALIAMLPKLHVAVLDEHDVVASTRDALDRITSGASMAWLGGTAHATPRSRSRSDRENLRHHIVLIAKDPSL